MTTELTFVNYKKKPFFYHPSYICVSDGIYEGLKCNTILLTTCYVYMVKPDIYIGNNKLRTTYACTYKSI